MSNRIVISEGHVASVGDAVWVVAEQHSFLEEILRNKPPSALYQAVVVRGTIKSFTDQEIMLDLEIGGVGNAMKVTDPNVVFPDRKTALKVMREYCRMNIVEIEKGVSEQRSIIDALDQEIEKL